MTSIEAPTAAAQAVLRTIAYSGDSDQFWTLIAVSPSAEEFPPEVEAHRSDVAGLAYYPKGVLAQYALGNTIKIVSAFEADEQDVERPDSVPHEGLVEPFDAGWNAQKVGLQRATVDALSNKDAVGWALLGYDTRALIIKRQQEREAGTG